MSDFHTLSRDQVTPLLLAELQASYPSYTLYKTLQILPALYSDEALALEILPIVIPYNKIGTELALSWKNIIGQTQSVHADSRLITVFTVDSLHKKLVHSSLFVSKAPNTISKHTVLTTRKTGMLY